MFYSKAYLISAKSKKIKLLVKTTTITYVSPSKPSSGSTTLMVSLNTAFTNDFPSLNLFKYLDKDLFLKLEKKKNVSYQTFISQVNRQTKLS